MMVRNWTCAASLLLALAGLMLPVGTADAQPVYWLGQAWLLLPYAATLAAAAYGLVQNRVHLTEGLLFTASSLLGGIAPLALLASGLILGLDAPGFWCFVLSVGLLAWRALEILSAVRAPAWIGTLLVPGLFGLLVLYYWQVLVVGFAVPSVLLPSPARIAQVFVGNLGQLWLDFRQTFLKSVIAGFVLGSGAGFITAILIDRSPFLQRGLLPLGAMVSAIPIVGIAPIMVMWFGFDWQSKAAVIVVMTFFPMLVNTLAGLRAAGDIERDLMRSYAASYAQTIAKLRLPNALPFVFNALKINSTLALIGAIVAEFFGTPVVGMGFRISVEIGRMNVDMVWATIVVAALSGSVFYGLLALLERGLTFWHPSYRQ
jgi:NitT/TauT family transport system permease protein